VNRTYVNDFCVDNLAVHKFVNTRFVNIIFVHRFLVHNMATGWGIGAVDRFAADIYRCALKELR